jgi:hypothetical protein
VKRWPEVVFLESRLFIDVLEERLKNYFFTTVLKQGP